MATSISTALFEAMRDRPGRVHPVVELTYDSTEYRFAPFPVVSESKGLYKPFLKSIERLSGSANIWSRSLDVPRFGFSIYDEERVLQKLFGGPLRGKMTTGLVNVWWRSEDVDAADHFQRFSGIVFKPRGQGRTFEFSATLDVRPLENRLKIPTFPLEHFPRAPERSHGQPLWTVYGKNYSSGIAESGGMISCLPLEKNAAGEVDLWLANYGKLGDIPRIVWDTDRTSDFTNKTIQRGKNLYHVIEYTGGNPHPDEDSDIRIDADGLLDTTPTTGTVITNPAEQMRHILANFVYGDGDVRPATSWASETGQPIGSSVWDDADTFYDVRGIEGAMVVRANDTGREIFDRWCSDNMAVPFLADGWKVAAKPRPDATVDIYQDDAHVAQLLQHARGELSFDSERAEPLTDLNVNYLFDDSRGVFTRSAKVSYRRDDIDLAADDFEIKFGKHTVF